MSHKGRKIINHLIFTTAKQNNKPLNGQKWGNTSR